MKTDLFHAAIKPAREASVDKILSRVLVQTCIIKVFFEMLERQGEIEDVDI